MEVNNKKRQSGYYWVNLNGEWLISSWNNDFKTWFHGTSLKNDSFWTTIDERQIIRHTIKGEDKYGRDVPESHAGWKPDK